MGYLEGLLGGFTSRKREVELRSQQEQDMAQQREGKILDALINSPDPEVRSHGIAGLLDTANPKPRMKGLRGFLGEVQSSPHLDTIRSIVAADQAGGFGPSPTPAEARQIPTAAGQAPLAQAATSPTEVGAPPPTPTEAAPTVEPSLARTAEGEPISPAAAGTPPPGPPPAGVSPMAVLGQGTPAPAAAVASVAAGRRQPRQIFQTPEGQMLLSKKAAAQGDVEGEVAGLVAAGIPQAEAANVVKQRMLRRGGVGATGFQSVAGTVINAETGQPEQAFGAFDRASGQYIGTDPDSPYYGIPIPGFTPRAVAAGQPRSYGMDREALAKSMFGKQFKELDQTQAASVVAEERKLLSGKAEARAAGTGIGQFNRPIGVSEAQRTNTVVGTSSAQYAGQEVASEAEQARRRGVENVNTQLDHIKTLLGSLPKQNELAGMVPGAALAIRRRSPQYRAQIAALDSAIDNILASLSRTIQENRGAQTEKDAERAYSTIAAMKGSLLDPAGGDTQESALARITETQGYLQTILGTLPGNPVPVGTPPPTATPPVGAAPGTGAPPPAPAPAAVAKPGAKPAAAAKTPGTYKDAQGNWHILTSARQDQF